MKYYWVVQRPETIPKDEEDDDMTAEQLAKLLPAAFAILAKEQAGEEFQEALDYCKDQGIMVGDKSGNQMPKKPLSREEAAQMVFNILNQKA